MNALIEQIFTNFKVNNVLILESKVKIKSIETLYYHHVLLLL